jgi:hypothetical protein
MASPSPQVNAAVCDIARETKLHGTDSRRLPELRRDLRAVQLEEHVRQVVESAPPLTNSQVETLALLLRSAGGPDVPAS